MKPKLKILPLMLVAALAGCNADDVSDFQDNLDSNYGAPINGPMTEITKDPVYTPVAEDFYIDAKDGQKMAAVYTVPDGLDNPPILVMHHGFGDTKGGTGSYVIKGLKESKYEYFARRFAEHGIATLRFDYINTTWDTFKSDGDWSDTTATGQIENSQTVLDYVKTLPNIDTRRIGFLGHSLGGLVAMSSAAMSVDDVKTTVLLSPVTNGFKDWSWMNAGMGGSFALNKIARKPAEELIESKFRPEFSLKAKFYQSLLDVDPVAAAGQYPNPLLVVRSLKDEAIINLPNNEELYMKYHNGDERLKKSDSDHGYNSQDGPEKVEEVTGWVIDWLRETL